jgi:hypothetical protein
MRIHHTGLRRVLDLVQVGGPFTETVYIGDFKVNPAQLGPEFEFRIELPSLVAGWWGIPWGPTFTIGALYNNLRGGKDVTAEVANLLMVQPATMAAA